MAERVALISETRRVTIPAGEIRHPLRGRRRRHHPAERDRHRPSRGHHRAQPRRLSALARDACSIARSAAASTSAAPRARPARCASTRRSSAPAPTAPSCCRRADGLRGAALHRPAGDARLRPGAAPACPRGRPCRSAPARRGRSPRRSRSPISPRASTGRPIMSPPVRRTAASIDLFAWLTLANSDETGFANADTQAVAGRLNRETCRARAVARAGRSPLLAGRWATTSDIPLEEFARCCRREHRRFRGRSSNRRLPATPASGASDLIAVRRLPMRAQRRRNWATSSSTASRSRSPSPRAARSRSPSSSSPASRSQLRLPAAGSIPGTAGDAGPASRLLITRNRAEEGLGLPLARRPADAVRHEAAAGRSWSARRSIDDHAVGEDVEIEFGEAPGVIAEIETPSRQATTGADYVLTVTNDQAVPVRYRGRVRGRRGIAGSGRATPARPARRPAALGGDGPGQRQRDPALPRHRDRR